MRSRQQGMSLVELMIALVVGSLVVLASAQAMVVFGSTYRRLLGDNSADQSAAIYLYNLAREVKAAGVSPVAFDGTLVCTNFNLYVDGDVLLDDQPLFPVTIEDGGVGPDVLTVAGFNSILAMAGTRLVVDMPDAGSTLRVASEAGFETEDFVGVGTPGSGRPCTLMQLTDVSEVPGGADFARDSADSEFNAPDPAATFVDAPAYERGSVVFNAGQLGVRRYEIADERLALTDLLTGVDAPLADHIVGLHARYGVAAVGGTAVEDWVEATGAWVDLDADEAARVRAVQVAVLARNPQRIRPPEGEVDCDATTANPVAWDGGPEFDVSGLPDWQCYQYRVFDLVIPLKNRIFQGS